MTEEFVGKIVPVGHSLLIGRLDTAGLHIANLEVSRRHCQIERDADGFRVTDLGSRSGTKLNDKPVQSAPIQHGDLLSIGPHLFRFEVVSSEDRRGAIVAPATIAVDEATGQLMLKEILLSEFNLAKQLESVTEQSTLERLRRNLELVQEFAEAIQTTLDTSALIELTLDELFRVFTKMDAGVIFLRDQATGELAPAAIRRRNERDSGPVGYSMTILRFVEAEHKAVLSLDVSQDERFQYAPSIWLGSMRTHMCVPLIVRGEVVGAVYLVAEGKEDSATGFDADDLSLLSSLAGTVAVCVKNAVLARETQRNAQLTAGLQRYVSPEVTRRLIEQGVEGALSARTIEGVAMFCDLVGFTTLSERLPPDRIAKILNRYFRRALDIVFRHNGSVNKFAGDSFLAVWGAIDPSPVDLSNAMRAALEIQNDTFRLSTEMAAEEIGSIQLTIGLSRGRFFAGDIGSADRLEFTVIGDTVNVASRIQALAHGSQVLTTLDSLGDARRQMSVVLYRNIPIRGRTADVTVASIRSIVTGSPAASSRDSSMPAGPTSITMTSTAFPNLLGSRILASIPLEVPDLRARAQLVGASLAAQVELELLCDRPAAVGTTYQLVPVLPEWDRAQTPVDAVCLGSLAEAPVHLVRLRLAECTDDLLALLRPGSERAATQPLRQKS